MATKKRRSRHSTPALDIAERIQSRFPDSSGIDAGVKPATKTPLSALQAMDAEHGGVEIWVDPAETTPWPYANRFIVEGPQLDRLVETIAAAGQKQPGLVRRLNESDKRYTQGYRYEVIYGIRRRRAAMRLGSEFRVIVCDISDHDALLEMDAENRGRADLHVLEQAHDYQQWLDAKHFGTAQELAQAVGITRSYMSKILAIAQLPKSVLFAYEDPFDLSMRAAYDLSRLLNEHTEDGSGSAAYERLEDQSLCLQKCREQMAVGEADGHDFFGAEEVREILANSIASRQILKEEALLARLQADGSPPSAKTDTETPHSQSETQDFYLTTDPQLASPGMPISIQPTAKGIARANVLGRVWVDKQKRINVEVKTDRLHPFDATADTASTGAKEIETAREIANAVMQIAQKTMHNKG